MILKVNNLFFAYSKNSTILENINFSLQEGEILCVCGENGTGKSTLLSLLAGILEAKKGMIECKIPLKEMSAMIFQDPDMQILGQSVLEEMLMLFPNHSDELLEKILKTLMDFELLEKKDALVSTLSYGQKRKLALASSLMLDPKILLYDEPSSHLDYPALLQLRKIILENKVKKISQCIVAHDIEMYADIADYFLLLHKGKQVFYGRVEDALNFIEENKNINIKLPAYWKIEKKIMPW